MSLKPPTLGRVRIRTVEAGDLDEILEINRKSFVLPYSSSVFKEFFREHRYAFLVAEYGGQVVGYSMSRILRKLSLRGLTVRKIGHIMSIAVDPPFRRRGIGKQLLRETIQVLEENDAEEIRLEVRVTNHLAIKIYKSFGFQEERILPGYYSDGEDAILMVRKAQPE